MLSILRVRLERSFLISLLVSYIYTEANYLACPFDRGILFFLSIAIDEGHITKCFISAEN